MKNPKTCYIKGYGSYHIKRDQYSKRFQDLFSILYISCKKCSVNVLLYQKDGKQGFLKRCYLNRMIWLNKNSVAKLRNKKSLNCPSCHALMGNAIEYKGRRAFAIFPNSFKRRTLIKNWSRGVKYKNQ